jgi:hypothetical protein
MLLCTWKTSNRFDSFFFRIKILIHVISRFERNIMFLLLSDDVKTKSVEANKQLFIDPAKLLPLSRFLPQPPGAKRIGGRRGGRGGGRGRGGPRGGGGFRGKRGV